jgi:hypothetical protein
MNGNWVDELLRLDLELETISILREHIPAERLYLVDRRVWLVSAINRMCDTEGEDSGWQTSEQDLGGHRLFLEQR